MTRLLHHEVLGPADGGAGTVLLAAGLGGTGAFWQPQLAALAATHRVILYDQRGTGRSAETLPDSHGIADMADDVAAILEALSVPECHFVGHALGGLIGLDLARRHPTCVASLVVINGWARLDSQTRRCFDVRRDLLMHVGPEAYVRAQPLFLYPAPFMSANPARMAAELAHGIAHFQGTDTLLKRIAALTAFDATALLPEITCRTLVTASRDDLLVPWTASKSLAEGLPRARLLVVSEGGHAFTATQPDTFNEALLAFLAT